MTHDDCVPSMARMLSVKVSSKHQVAVPSEVRRRLGIQAGDRLEVRIREGEFVLVPRARRASERLDGIGRGMYGPDPESYIAQLRAEWDERLATLER